jgi:hypothetical protein
MLLRYSARGRCGVVGNDLNSPSKSVTTTTTITTITTTACIRYFILSVIVKPQPWQTKGGKTEKKTSLEK